jgi:hypothetical protein
MRKLYETKGAEGTLLKYYLLFISTHPRVRTGVIRSAGPYPPGEISAAVCFFDDRGEMALVANCHLAIPSGSSGAPTPSRPAGETLATFRVSPDQEDRPVKNWLINVFAIAALVLALSFPISAPAAPPAAKPQPAPAAAAAEPHPRIREAIEALRAARGDLNKASHDFGGHRADAIRTIDESIHQLQICLQYDK